MRRFARLSTFLFVLFINISFSFAQNGQEIIFEENFNNNQNGWTVLDDWNRNSNISSGILVDYFKSDGYQQSNIISANFDVSIDHKITIKIANLNNQENFSYYTYKQKKNGKVVKVNTINHPAYAIVFGFKDWENYHAIKFYTKKESYSPPMLNHLIYSRINGQTIIHSGWSDYGTLGMNENTGFITIDIEKVGNEYLIYNDKYGNGKNEYRFGTIPLTQWYGNSFGFIIPAGTKIAVDYIKITKKNSSNSNINLSYVDIKKEVKKIDSAVDSVNVYITTNPNGKRKIYIYDNRSYSGLQNDYKFCLDFSKTVFKFIFAEINYQRETPISFDNLKAEMLKLSIIGIEMKTELRTYNFNWEEVATE